MERTKKLEVPDVEKDFQDPVQNNIGSQLDTEEMTRTGNIREVEQDPDEGKVKWRKTGGGSFRTRNGKIIKPNQVFMAHPDDIPEGFRDVIVPVHPEDPSFKPEKPRNPKYEIVSGTLGWYNVIDENGKQMNEKQLRQDKAEELVESLGA